MQHHAYFKVDLVHFSFKTFNVFKNLLSREEQGLCFSASSDNFCVYTVSDIQTEDGNTLVIWILSSIFFSQKIRKNLSEVQIPLK